jgi:positive regulator of sigma E activity
MKILLYFLLLQVIISILFSDLFFSDFVSGMTIRIWVFIGYVACSHYQIKFNRVIRSGFVSFSMILLGPISIPILQKSGGRNF